MEGKKQKPCASAKKIEGKRAEIIKMQKKVAIVAARKKL